MNKLIEISTPVYDHHQPSQNEMDDFQLFVSSLGMTFGELRRLELSPVVEILHCLPGDFVGMLNSVTNGGKSTLVRNLLINLCIGKPFEPITSSVTPKRVALLDFEDTLGSLKMDLNTMCSHLKPFELAMVEENALILCEESFPGEMDMTLSESAHLDALIERLVEFKPRLIIVETISSAFRIRDENNNAEIKNEVIAPLRRLARETHAAVLATHHIGKRTEDGRTTQGGHTARGASSFGDHSRLVMNLDFNERTGNTRLQCGKSKGHAFPDTIFTLDPNTRWLNMKEVVRSGWESLPYYLEDDRIYSTGEIQDLLKGIGTVRKVARWIKIAKDMRSIEQVSHGKYRKLTK